MASSQRSLDLDIVTLRHIYARDASNCAIMSNYALLADGKGGTYWSTVVTGVGGGIAISSFSTSIGTSFYSQVITTPTLTTQTLTTQSFTTNTLTVSALQLTGLALCNIFINNNGQNYSDYNNLFKFTSGSETQFDFKITSNTLGNYLFIRSPSNVVVLPPNTTCKVPGGGTDSNTFAGVEGNFFVVKNMGAVNVFVATSNASPPGTTTVVIPQTSATFFYLGGNYNYWTPM